MTGFVPRYSHILATKGLVELGRKGEREAIQTVQGEGEGSERGDIDGEVEREIAEETVVEGEREEEGKVGRERGVETVGGREREKGGEVEREGDGERVVTVLQWRRGM